MTTLNGSGLITESQAVGLLRGMLEIPSPSYHESALAQQLVSWMRELGFTAHVDPAGNAVGEIQRGDGPTIMLLGHMDTIPGQLPVRSVEGRLYGRGAVDAKGPLAAMICAAASALEFQGRIIVVGVVEEETPSSYGAMAIRRTHSRPDALIVGEPSGWSNVVLGYKGKLDLRYEVNCRATHPSNPVPKASEFAAGCWSAVAEIVGPAGNHASFDRPAATLVSIAGDIANAHAEVSIRIPPSFDVDAFVGQLRDTLPTGELSVINVVPACRTDRRDPVVRALFAAIRGRQGSPTAVVKTATSDMNTMAEVWDMPMATYGPGDSSLDHSDDEHILLADYFRGIAVLTAALVELSTGLVAANPDVVTITQPA
jgi:LysW-gamma-L-lysine carboxypeptidase